MLKPFLSILLICFSFITWGQSSDNDTRKFHIGATFSPDYNYRTLTSDKSSNTDYRNDLESAKFGYTTGLTFSYQFSKRFATELGIMYADKGYKRSGIDFTDEYGNELGSVTLFQRFKFLDIPIKANYYFLQKERFQLYATAGFSTNFLLKLRSVTKYDYSDSNTSNEKTAYDSNLDGFNSINFSGVVGIGAEYKLTDRFKIRCEPMFRHDFTDIYTHQDHEINQYFYSFGANVGLFLGF